MTVTFPNLAPNALVDASQLNTNYADCIAAANGLTTKQLASAAGIVSGQIADRFSTQVVRIPIVSITANASDLSTTTRFAIPNTTADPGTEMLRHYLALRSGKAAYLTKATLRAVDIGSSGTSKAKVWLTKNGTMLGGAGIAVAAATTIYSLTSGVNFMDVPICSLANGDYLGVGLGQDGGTGNPTIRGLDMWLTFKFELGA